MRNYILLFLLFFVACATEPPRPEPSPAFEAGIRSLRNLPAPFAAAALSAAAPLGEQVLSDSRLSVTVAGHLGAHQTRDRSWIVQVGPATRVIRYASTAGRVGAVLNLSGANQANVLTRTVAVPLSVVASDSLIVVAGNGNVMEEAMAVVFVPFPVGHGMLRPPAIGNSPLTRLFREWPLYESWVDMARVPATIDLARIYQPGGPVHPAGWGAAPPTIPALLDSMGRFWGDTIDGWGAAGSGSDRPTPNKQHLGYGTFVAGEISTALCMCVSTLPEEQRFLLTLALVQRGIDVIGATADGRVFYPNGGHCQGRKALFIFAGHALGVDWATDPSALIQNVFAEDPQGYPSRTPAAWWFGSGWTAGWAFRKEAPWNGQLLANHPSTWGDRNAPNHDTWNWLFGYFSQVVPCQVGTALTMTILGREREMGASVQMVRQWMAGPPPDADAALRAAGHIVPWGTDYAGPAGFASTAWRIYGR